MRIKIAFFIASLEEGGAEYNLIKILSGLSKGRYEILLLLGKRKGSFLSGVPKEIPIINLKTYSFPFLCLKVINFLKKEKPDILISTFPRFNIINILAKKFSKTETKIVLIEQTIISELRRSAKNFINRQIARFILPFLIKFIYPKADSIICVSGGVAKDLEKLMGVSPQIRVIYNPIVEEKIYKLSTEAVEHHWFKNKKIPIILSAGRLIKSKDYPSLLLAFSQVLKEMTCRLVILGEGKERKNLEKFSKKLGIAENVAFLGFQKNPYKFMKQSSVFVLHSLREGFSNVIVEAMALGLPLVSTNCLGPLEITENGKYALIVTKRDETAMADAILKILKDSSLRKKLSEAGEKRAQDFTVEKSVKEYERIFEQIL